MVFFYIYCGEKFEENSFINPLYNNISDTISNNFNNCTVIVIKDFDSFSSTAYTLF